MKLILNSILKLIFFLSLCSYSYSYAYEAPCIHELWQINCSLYVAGKNDCTDKAVDYCNVLNTQNYYCNVIAGTTKNSNVPHAWAEVIMKGHAYWIDPTYGTKCKLKKDWRRKAWYKYRKGVTKQEVRKYKGIITIYKDAPKNHKIN